MKSWFCPLIGELLYGKSLIDGAAKEIEKQNSKGKIKAAP